MKGISRVISHILIIAALIVYCPVLVHSAEYRDYSDYPSIGIHSYEDDIKDYEGITYVLSKDTKPEDIILQVNMTQKTIGFDDKKLKIVYGDGIWNCPDKVSKCVRKNKEIYEPKHKRIGNATYSISSPAKITVSVTWFANNKKQEKEVTINF